ESFHCAAYSHCEPYGKYDRYDREKCYNMWRNQIYLYFEILGKTNGNSDILIVLFYSTILLTVYQMKQGQNETIRLITLESNMVLLFVVYTLFSVHRYHIHGFHFFDHLYSELNEAWQLACRIHYTAYFNLLRIILC